MCDPATLFIASAVTAGAGKIFEGISGYNSNKVSKALAIGNEHLLDTEATIAEGNADLAVTRGNYDEFLTRRKGGQVLGAERNYYAGNNVDPTYGSPLAMQGFSAGQIEQDAQLIRAKTAAERADALTQGANIRGQAAGQAFKADAADTAAHTSLISGAIGAATNFLLAGSKWPGLSPSSGFTPSAPSGGGPLAINIDGSRFLAGNSPWGS